MLLHLVLFLIGITLLYAGGESFIKGSSNTARIFGIKPLIVGIVIVAFATSAPEFFVSFLANLRRSQSIAIGNVVGSNICNIGLVLGLAALVKPISVNISFLRREIPILIVTVLLFFAICLDFTITRAEGLILLSAFALFIFYCIKNAKVEVKDLAEYASGKRHSKPLAFLYLVFGLGGLLLGAHFLVDSSIYIARYFNISELVIGLSVVAIGTSLPELSASLVASMRGESDISIGNVIGSNIFNLLAIIGVVCLIRPISIEPSVVIFNLPIMLIYTLVLIPVLKSGFKISRSEGAVLLVSYFLYLYLVYKR